MKRISTALAFGVVAALSASTANAAITFYNSRPAFEATLGTFITDGYDAAGYDLNGPGLIDVHSNAYMSSVLGETDYTTTGHQNVNIIFNQSANAQYCAGCNGSFRLSFTTTSVGNASGVYGAGMDVMFNSGSYIAFITFGDNSTMNVSLPTGGFWGVTADQMITSIHFGLANGGTRTDGSFGIDNLTIGSAVPAPGALALLGAAGLVARRRRRA